MEVPAGMEESNVEVRCSPEKGRGLFALKFFSKGETIFEELPLISSQFSWNEDTGYEACELCMRPLETAEENLKRLTCNEISHLPYPEQCKVDKSRHTSCVDCGVKYCSIECLTQAWNKYHKTLCLKTHQRDGSHPLEMVKEMWKQIHYPPESATIMLFIKIFALIHQSDDKDSLKNKLQQFYHNMKNEKDDLTHKLLGLKYANQVELIREAIVAHVPTDDAKEWTTPQGFLTLMALVGMNGQGIGTSSFGEWVKNVSNIEMPIDEKNSLHKYIDKIYESIENGVGEFVNNEGSGLYFMESLINHSCKPNSEITFPHSNYQLVVKAIENINPGEEICISYLDECILERSRHSRQGVLQENYLFTCKCIKCEEEEDQVSETSYDESEELSDS